MIEDVDPASCAGPRHLRWRRPRNPLFTTLSLVALAPALVCLLAAAISPGLAETAFSFAPGDSAMTGFSGTVLALPSLPPGVAPIDKTVIDVDAPSLSVFDLSTLGGAPQGRAISPTVKLSVKAKDIGQVFPLAFDSWQGRRSAEPLRGRNVRLWLTDRVVQAGCRRKFCPPQSRRAGCAIHERTVRRSDRRRCRGDLEDRRDDRAGLAPRRHWQDRPGQ